MKSWNGWKQGFNGQAMVDCNSQVIVAQSVTDEANDVEQLEPMIEECKDVNGECPGKVVADAGYWSKSNMELEDDETELFIATKKDSKRR